MWAHAHYAIKTRPDSQQFSLLDHCHREGV